MSGTLLELTNSVSLTTEVAAAPLFLIQQTGQFS
ncbi:hypothetical protein SAMN05877753_103198 [Bacillus oleivorans]|uniref:Uncharacterized protein n=1 Tax=Bacillus oleivorans TaxID=1448271 RepID=A0A285CQM3_9BACI|nr:hypothetical protein SAMN05877753_103198 [Bacillus oleivorans]